MTSQSTTCLQQHGPISDEQINQLIAQGCTSDDWSKVTDGTVIYKCFVGQGTVLSRHYSAEN
jgi:hypothetical protein